MGFWGDSREAAEQVKPSEVYDDDVKHEAKFSHELLAGGAAYYGFKKFEDEQRKEGKVVEHAVAKEMLAGIVAGLADKLVETKGRDEWDKIQKKHQVKELAKERAEKMYDEHYDQTDNYNPNDVQKPSFSDNI